MATLALTLYVLGGFLATIVMTEGFVGDPLKWYEKLAIIGWPIATVLIIGIMFYDQAWDDSSAPAPNRSRSGRWQPGVAIITDRAGTAVFVHEDGRFRQLTDAPAFAETVRQAGYGDALSSIFR